MLLVILIALWALVLLPQYLKDRRASGRTFDSLQSGGLSSAQRFLPLQKAATRHSTSPIGVRTGGVNPVGTQASTTGRPVTSGLQNIDPAMLAPAVVGPASEAAGNVVQLRPLDGETIPESAHASMGHSAVTYRKETPLPDETLMHQGWEGPDNVGIGMPSSTADARERRRHVLLAMLGVALLTLMFALFAGGQWIAAHVFVDVVMLGYVILLVRHRQLMADLVSKIEPIRPPVTGQAIFSGQIEPSYLLSENTGS